MSLDILLRMQRKVLANQKQDIENDEECHCFGRGYIAIKDHTGWHYKVCPACDPKPQCPLCHGTGHIEQEKNGYQTFLPHGCSCYGPTRKVEYLNRAQIPGKYANAEFGFDFDDKSINDLAISDDEIDEFLNTRRTVQNFCKNAIPFLKSEKQEMERYFLILMGPVGTGKTHLAATALKHLIWESEQRGLFIEFQQLLNRIRDVYAQKISEDEVMRPLRKAPILVLDELGKGRIESEWELEKLDDIINSRYNDQKITIITTNFMHDKDRNEFFRQVRKERENTIKEFQNVAGKDKEFYNKNFAQKGLFQVNELHLIESLPERIGNRLYDRLIDVSVFVSFINKPSLRMRHYDLEYGKKDDI